MANTEIDSLSLDIRITGLKKEDVANIDKLSKAVQRLTKSLKEADFSKLKEIQVPKGLKNIQIITQNIKNSVAGAVGETTSETMAEATELLHEYADGVEGVAGRIEDSALVIQKADKEIKLSNRQAKKALGDLYAELDGKKKKTAFEKMLDRIGKTLKRFKTIAFIKAVRAILNAIVSAVKTGITNLAQFDKEFNDTISSIKTAGTNISDSMILAFRPVIESLEPFIVAFSQALATVGNEVSRLQSIMKGTSTYTKINAKYMEDFANASKKASLFSFDTFETLSGSETNNKFETAETTTGEEDKSRIELIQSIQDLLGSSLGTIRLIGSEVKKILALLSPIFKLIAGIGAGLNGVLDTLFKIIFDTLNPFLEDLSSTVNELVDLILNGILSPLLSILNTVLKPIYSLLEVDLTIISNIVGLVVDVLSPILESFKPVLDDINEILSPIMEVISFIVELVGGLIGSVIDFIKIGLRPIIEIIENIVELIRNLVSLIKGIFTLSFKDFFRKLGLSLLKFLASMVDSVVNLIIDGLNIIWAPINALSDWFGWGWKIGIPHINLASLVPSFANGGFVGEIWQMNEYGNPEMLYNANNNSNNTAVINQAQLSLAFEQAIYNTGLLEAIAKAGIINIDGRAIAQSNSFKNEINRTNPGLNIR